MHTNTQIVATLVFSGFSIASTAQAQEATLPPALSFSGSLTGFSQSVVSGTENDQLEFGGKLSASVLINGGKVGLWPGFFINASVVHSFGNDVNFEGDGTILPLNTALAFPSLGGNDTEWSLTLTQALSRSVAVTFGKFDMLKAAEATPLLGGGGLSTFQNMGLAAPVSGVTPPYVLGGILSVKTSAADYALFIYDPRNAQDSDVLSSPFEDGVTYSLSATVPFSFNSMPGFHGVRLVHSTQDGLDLASLPQLVLPPGSENAVASKKGYSYISYSFQQYFADFGGGKGWGVFGQFALSDGNPNPIKSSVILGLGGNSFLEGRSDDKWGFAYFRYNFSDDLKDGLAGLGTGIRDEYGIEAFYDVKITDAFTIGANIQAIRPGTPDTNDVIAAGLRAKVSF